MGPVAPVENHRSLSTLTVNDGPWSLYWVGKNMEEVLKE